jgi:F0F1-type ATP synthase membrane subunit b/b'
MGAEVSAVRDQIEEADDAKGKEAEVKEALENMRQTAQDLLDAFNERIRSVNGTSPHEYLTNT